MIDDRLTEDIEAGAKARPRFSTEIVETDGGWEVRNSRWEYPLHDFEFNVTPGLIDEDGQYDPDIVEEYEETIEAFLSLFYAAGGAFETFRFRHWADYRGEDEPIGTGTGIVQTLQLKKTYSRGLISRTRKITRPVAGTVVIYFDGVDATGACTINHDTGEVACIPGLGVAVTADFEFDIPCRFADDQIEIIAHTRELQQPVNIAIKEDRE